MEILKFDFPANTSAPGRAHVGVVGSGDLEVLLEPNSELKSVVNIRTSVAGFSAQWEAVLKKFFSRYDRAVKIDVNDAGATPGVVSLRLAQAAEACEK